MVHYPHLQAWVLFLFLTCPVLCSPCSHRPVQIIKEQDTHAWIVSESVNETKQGWVTGLCAYDSTLVVLTGTVSPSHVIHHSRLTRYSVHPFSVSFSLPSLYSLTSPTFTQLMWVRVRVWCGGERTKRVNQSHEHTRNHKWAVECVGEGVRPMKT